MIYLREETWRKYIQNWFITDCAVRDRNIIYLCLREDIPNEKASLMWDHDILTRQFALYLDTFSTAFWAAACCSRACSGA